MSELRKIRRALISVSDKSGIVEFARKLANFGVEIISTGGTAKALREAGLSVVDIADITGFPEMMDGRVKTLHPKIHGAFLALRNNDEHVEAMRKHEIEPIDILVVNLYPFEQTIAKTDVSLEEAVENIDIGGPAMIRSASKNWRDVAVVTDSSAYSEVINELQQNDGSLSLETRRRLAALAFTRTASYDSAISSYLAKQLSNDDRKMVDLLDPLKNMMLDEWAIELKGRLVEREDKLPKNIDLFLEKSHDLRYGENPHQNAAMYKSGEPGGLANSHLLHGREMSFNNYVDAEAAWNLVQDFDERAVAIIKHTNPSGVGIGSSNEEAYRRALSTDPVSAFGGIVAFNLKVDAAVAALVIEVFSEVIVAPEYDHEALEIFRSKKNLRILKLPATNNEQRTTPEYKQISGGFLV